MRTREEYIEWIKDAAERSAEKIKDNNFGGSVAFFTEGNEVPRVVFFPRIASDDPMGRNKLLYAFRVLSAAIDDLESIAYCVDTYHTTSKLRTDGTAWGYNGMQEAFVNKTIDAHLVSEALHYQVLDKDGRAALISLPYERTTEGIEFQWNDTDVMIEGEDEGKLTGFIPDAMKDAFAQPKLMDEMQKHLGIKPEDMGLNEVAGRIHTLAVGVKMVLTNIQMPCLLLARSKEEAEIIRDSMAGGPMSENIRAFSSDDLLEIETLEEAFEQPSFERDLGLTNQGDLTKDT